MSGDQVPRHPDGSPLSLWHDQGPSPTFRPPLAGRAEVDVVIVGGGYTGLWTAYYLAQARPDLSVMVLEAEFCGFGASGRNGGWCSFKFPGRREAMAADHGKPAVVAYQRAMLEAIDEVGRVAGREGIECDYRKGGMLLFATSKPQVERLVAYRQTLLAWGFGDEDVTWLAGDEAGRRGAVAGARAAIHTRHCASLHPWRLVHGLVEAVERRGVVVHEHSPVRRIVPGVAITEHGGVRARMVLRCTEAFTPAQAGQRRTLAPLYSLMIATEPLPEAWWKEVGLSEGETFSDERHLIVYGQRTADGRLAFGGRGAPYHLGSTVRPEWDRDPAVHQRLAEVLWELFPQLGEAGVTHRWGGPVAVPRDWRMSVDLDVHTGLGHAGGYVGQGVTSANLGGRTLADLALGLDTPRTRLPFVGHRWRRWEPEPLRWAGINLGRSLAHWADARETRTGRPARYLAAALARLTGS